MNYEVNEIIDKLRDINLEIQIYNEGSYESVSYESQLENDQQMLTQKLKDLMNEHYGISFIK
jgi:hypothetical protein